ncbi:WD repeat-containing protein 25 [Phytophthora ramorum]
MDAILDYASSSPSSSPDAAHRVVAQRVAGQRRVFARHSAHQSTREESAFAFRGYAAKRRRRRGPSESQASASVASVIDDVPLIASDEEIADFLSTESKHKKMVPLRRQIRQRFIGHDRAVNELQWHPKRPDLFLSASMDATVRVWQSSVEKSRRVLMHHSLGVKSVKWSIDGRQIFTGSYDGVACCIDAETGQVRQELRRPDIATPSPRVERILAVCCHPTELNLLLLGTDQGHIYGHDLREKIPHHAVTTYTKSFADVHDLLFLGDDGQQFVSSADVMQCDASSQTLLVWDWRSATLLYDRLDSNMLAHPCLRAHPTRPYFVAQCRGNYATLYSSRAPYKCLKGPSIGEHRPPLRYEGGHEVEGYRIQCSFSRDGMLWASGDANGRVAVYRTAGKRNLVDTFQLYGRRSACISAEFQSACTESVDSSHALLTSSSAGDIDLFQQAKP